MGEGEEKEKIKDYLDENNISHRVFLTGGKKPDQLSVFLNASDLFIMGSYKEGWSTTLSEAISCGIPSCVTNFSSAKEIISEGLNGFVIDDRNEGLFVERMQDAIKIKRPVYNDHVRAFSTNKLKEDLLGMWQLY
jgi:glycosyltransferase involved in cell wall biosynthesis